MMTFMMMMVILAKKCNLAECSALTQYRHRHRFSGVHDDEDVDKGVCQTGLGDGDNKGKKDTA